MGDTIDTTPETCPLGHARATFGCRGCLLAAEVDAARETVRRLRLPYPWRDAWEDGEGWADGVSDADLDAYSAACDANERLTPCLAAIRAAGAICSACGGHGHSGTTGDSIWGTPCPRCDGTGAGAGKETTG